MSWNSVTKELCYNRDLTLPLKDCRHIFLLLVCLENLLHVNKASLLHQILKKTKHSNQQSCVRQQSETKAHGYKTTKCISKYTSETTGTVVRSSCYLTYKCIRNCDFEPHPVSNVKPGVWCSHCFNYCAHVCGYWESFAFMKFRISYNRR